MIEERIREIIKQELPLKDKLSLVARELAEYFKTDIYFCEIIGKRWSFVAGNGDIIHGSERLQLNQKWGIISSNKIEVNAENNLILNIIRGSLND